MKHLGIEWMKITKSREYIFSFAFLFLLILSFLAGFKIKTPPGLSRLDFIFMSLGNLVGFMMLPLVVIVWTGVSVAKEFSYKTFRYVMIRPVSLKNFLLNKFTALFLSTGKALLFIGMISFILGWLFLSSGGLHGKGNIILNQSLARFLVFYGGEWFNMILVISLTTLFSVLLKNHITAIIVTFSFFYLMLFCGRFFDEQVLYLTPIAYYNYKAFIFGENILWDKILKSLFVTFSYSLVLLSTAYWYLKRKDILI